MRQEIPPILVLKPSASLRKDKKLTHSMGRSIGYAANMILNSAQNGASTVLTLLNQDGQQDSSVSMPLVPLNCSRRMTEFPMQPPFKGKILVQHLALRELRAPTVPGTAWPAS